MWLLMPALLMLSALACNLAAEPAAPIIQTGPTNTPPPTIGFATLAPDQLPQAVQVVATPIQANLTNLLDQVSPERLMAHITMLQNFRTRHVNSTTESTREGVGAARDYVWQQFTEIANASEGRFSVNVQGFNITYDNVQTRQTNIIGTLVGSANNTPALILGAHYDSINRLSLTNGEAYAPGANDNGSGVAAMLEIARILSRNQPRQTIIFVAFGAEEIGRRGSIYFANRLIENGTPIMGMINLDIIGSATGPNGEVNDTQIRLYSAEPNDSPSRQFARSLNLLEVLYAPEMETVLQPAEDRIGRYSDQMSFTEVGIPAVRFIEMLEEVERQHTDRDDTNDIQPLYLTRATKTVLSVVQALAYGIMPPRNIGLREVGDGLRELVWEPIEGATGYTVALRFPGSLIFNQYFPVQDGTSVQWDSFIPSKYEALAIAVHDENGQIGLFSAEYRIP
jgi:hypothetical protein